MKVRQIVAGNDYANGILRMKRSERVERARSMPQGVSDIRCLGVDGLYSAEGSERSVISAAVSTAASTAALVSESGADASSRVSLRSEGPGSAVSQLALRLAGLGCVALVAAFLSALSLALLLNVPDKGPEVLRILILVILGFTFGSSFSALFTAALHAFLALRGLRSESSERVLAFLADGLYLRSFAFLGLAMSFPLLLFALIMWCHVSLGSSVTAWTLSLVLGTGLLVVVGVMGQGVLSWAARSRSSTPPPESPSVQAKLAHKLSTLV